MNVYQWLCLIGVPSIIGLMIGLFIKRPIEKRIAAQEEEQKTAKKQNDALMLGVQALLQDRLLQAYKYYEEQGWASYEDKKVIENMHTQYESLGENGVMTQRHNRFLTLPDYP